MGVQLRGGSQHHTRAQGENLANNHTTHARLDTLKHPHAHDCHRFDIFDDLRPYFQDYSHTDSVYSPRPGAKLLEAHALLLVGYNNSGRYWVAR